MQDQKNNDIDIFTGKVFDYISNESIHNKHLWYGNGGMIDNFNDGYLRNSRIGVNFLINYLNTIKPKKILETGTNYGSFSFVCYETLKDFDLQTCDIMQESERVINFINASYQKENVRFNHKDSLVFLQEKLDNKEVFDLAWIDSAHNYEHLIKELDLCAALDIPNIIVDDFAWIRDVQLGVFDFLKKYEKYTFNSYSNNNFAIGSIVTIKKI